MMYFECYADESFLRFLGVTSKELSGGHSNGRSNVSRKLKKSVNAIGFIDEDPGAAKDDYLKYLFSLNPGYSDKHLFCVTDPQTNNHLIVIKPDLEVLTINLARERNIDLFTEFGLSMNREALHDMLRIERNLSKRRRMIDFFSTISNHSTLIKLKELIKA